jgi:tetratricopeptide (TPR) repeat protein
VFGTIRTWLGLRAALREAERRRAEQSFRNTAIVEDRLGVAHQALKEANRDYGEAILDTLLADYPEEAARSPGTVRVLIQLQRIDEAARLTAQGVRRDPDSKEFAFFHCQVADFTADARERLRRWRAFRRRFPANALGYIFESRVLHELGQAEAADALLATGVATITDRVDLATEYAASAGLCRDPDEAIRRWIIVRDAHRDVRGALEVAGALARQGRLDEADAALLASREVFGNEPKLMEERARLAEQRGDVDAAILRWEELRREFPHVVQAYIDAGRLLRERGDAPAAEALLAEGGSRAAGHPAYHVEAAWTAERLRHWADAAQRWARVRTLAPHRQDGFLRAAVAYRELGMLTEAEEILAAGVKQFPEVGDFHRQRAQLAEARADWPLAAQYWRRLVDIEPESAPGHASLAQALARLGAAENAETLCDVHPPVTGAAPGRSRAD